MAFTATATALVNGYLTAISSTCESQTSNIMVCDMHDVNIKRCNINLSCENDGSVVTQVCSNEDVINAVASAVQTTQAQMKGIPADVLSTMQALTSNFTPPGGLPPGASAAEIAMAAYITTRCSEIAVSSQAVTMPQLQVTDCVNDTVRLLNQLDQTVRCSVNAISELVPPDPVPTTYPDPYWDQPEKLSFVVVGAVLLAAISTFLVSIIIIKTRTATLPKK